MKFDMLQALALRILQVKILPQKLKNVTPKATNPTPKSTSVVHHAKFEDRHVCADRCVT